MLGGRPHHNLAHVQVSRVDDEVELLLEKRCCAFNSSLDNRELAPIEGLGEKLADDAGARWRNFRRLQNDCVA